MTNLTGKIVIFVQRLLLLSALVAVAVAGRRQPRFFLPAISVEKRIHFNPHPNARWWTPPATAADAQRSNAPTARCWFMTCSVVKSGKGDDVIVMNDMGHVLPTGGKGKHHSRRITSVLWKPCCLWPLHRPSTTASTTSTTTMATISTTSGDGDDVTTDSIVFSDGNS